MTQSPLSLTLSADMLQNLASQVDFETDGAVHAFVADAINSYLHLGRLYSAGGEFLFAAEGRDDQIVLHFPFQQD